MKAWLGAGKAAYQAILWRHLDIVSALCRRICRQILRQKDNVKTRQARMDTFWDYICGASCSCFTSLVARATLARIFPSRSTTCTMEGSMPLDHTHLVIMCMSPWAPKCCCHWIGSLCANVLAVCRRQVVEQYLGR